MTASATRRIHLTAGEAGAVAARTGAARLVLTHFLDRAGPDALLAAAAMEYAGVVDLAQPGMTLKQRRLASPWTRASRREPARWSPCA